MTTLETKIVNLRHEPYDAYIGRLGKGQDGYFGNAHEIGYCPICKTQHDRVSCIAAFKKDFYQRIEADPEYRKRVENLKGYTLGCFCKPAQCHGDVLKEWLDRQSN